MNLQELYTSFKERVKKATSLEDIDAMHIEYLGRKGKINDLMKEMKELPEEKRKEAGLQINILKNGMISEIENVQSIFANQKLIETLKAQTIDLSEPSFTELQGHRHPLSIVQREVEEIFTRMGFLIENGPEVESEFYNFEALNVPSYHPARDLQDTIWLEDNSLMRTQTSPVQIRSMLKYGAPLRLIVPGRVFRYEATDASHDHTFYQVEGLMVDKNISIADMNGIMEAFLGEIFETKAEVRLRPGYFPFVEPGMELDMKCTICGGKGCRVCKQTGWIEFMGCGMVHPNVLRAGNIDPSVYQGFAFGFGLSRLVLMKYQIPNIRLLLQPHYQFNIQF